jgi:probable phosphoglycerate mutase
MSILLVRHGETDFNAARVIQMPDTPLNERGLEQARRLAARLRARPVARILSSDCVRTRMTAEALAEETSAPVLYTPSLRERHFGDHRGLSYDALGFDLFAPGYAPPGGEDWDVFNARVGRAWQEVSGYAAGLAGDLAVVSHGLVCRAVVERHARLRSDLDPATSSWGNTALTVIEGDPPDTISLLACTAHLDGSDVADGNQLAGL